MIKKPYLIAEIGSSHMGNLKLAYLAIAEAKKGGADCVKFQSWSKDTIFSKKKYESFYLFQKNILYFYLWCRL